MNTAPIGQLTHLWSVFNFTFILYLGINVANLCHGDVVQCHKVTELKASGATSRARDEAFQTLQDQCFLWQRRAPVGADFDLFNLTDLLHAQKPKQYTKGHHTTKKRITGAL